jgi:hypothetical protein
MKQNITVATTQVDIDEIARRLTDNGMSDYCSVSIEYKRGFEIGNFRPYECYETWCNIWVVTIRTPDGKAVRWKGEDGYDRFGIASFRDFSGVLKFLEQVKLAHEQKLW